MVKRRRKVSGAEDINWGDFRNFVQEHYLGIASGARFNPWTETFRDIYETWADGVGLDTSGVKDFVSHSDFSIVFPDGYTVRIEINKIDFDNRKAKVTFTTSDGIESSFNMLLNSRMV